MLGLTLRDQGFAVSVPAVAALPLAATVPAVAPPGAAPESMVTAATGAGGVVTAYVRSAGCLRSGPGKDYSAIDFVAAGDELLVGQKEGRWYRLVVGDSDDPRWIHESLVRVSR